VLNVSTLSTLSPQALFHDPSFTVQLTIISRIYVNELTKRNFKMIIFL
jgi:hypothetical protein